MRFFSEPEFLFTAKIINLCEGISVQDNDNYIAKPDHLIQNNESIDILNDRIKALEKEVRELSHLKREVDLLKNMNRGNSVLPDKKEIITLKEKPNKIRPDNDEIIVYKKEIAYAEKILSLTQRYIINSNKDPLVGMSVNKFKVVSMDEDTITIYPDRALNMMDFYFDNNGDKI